MVKKADRPAATGAPVRFSADEVASLVRGEMPEEHIARMLEANPGPIDTRRTSGGKAKRPPITLTAAELADLAAGKTGAEVLRQLEKSAAMRRPRIVSKRRGSKPSIRPPGKAPRSKR